MVWIDRLALPALIAIPLLGALFLFLIPTYETLLRKKVALFIVLVTAAFHVRNTVLLFKGKFSVLDLDLIRPSFLPKALSLNFDFIACATLSFLLSCVFTVLFCRLSYARQRDFKFGSKILFSLGIANATVLSTDFGFTLLLHFALMQMLLFFALGGTHPHRNSNYLLSSLYFCAVDLAAFFVWSWQPLAEIWLGKELLTIVLILPFLTRLLVPFFSPWARGLFENVSTEVTILFMSTSFIVASASLARVSFESTFLANAATCAALFASLLAISERSPSAFVLRLSSMSTATSLFLFASGAAISKLTIVIHLCSVALVTAFSLLVQRSLLATNQQDKSASLLVMWFLNVLVLAGIQFKMLPLNSLIFTLAICITIFAVALQLRSPLRDQDTVPQSASKQLSYSVIANVWLSFGLIAVTVSFFQFFPMAVLPS